MALLDALDEARRRTLDLVAELDDDTVHRPLDPIMSPLVWDLGHIAAYEELWCVHRISGAPLLHPELAAAYDAFETPRAVRGEIELLDRPQALAYLDEVRERTLTVLDEHGERDLHELALRHELQHTETMRQALFLGGHPAGSPNGSLPRVDTEPRWVEIPAGPFAMGAADDAARFAYDNEKPRHEAQTGAFRITRTPIANATFLRFVEGGGYVRREWWSDEGWAWKEEYDITHPLGWTGAADDRPVQHLSWFEADAFARSLGARLPTEQEWEKASTWDHGGAPALAAVGAVWEWTASEFTGYPGFRAHPYREYSEVFFDHGYRVLRGGSWAASPRVATRTFRSWDLPERRQIFSGVRLAADPSAEVAA